LSTQKPAFHYMQYMFYLPYIPYGYTVFNKYCNIQSHIDGVYYNIACKSSHVTDEISMDTYPLTSSL